MTETLEAIQMAKAAGYTAVISHRSGETEDPPSPTWPWAPPPSDQDRFAVPFRSRLQVQPAAAHEEQLGAKAPYRGRAEFRS